MLVSDFDYDLPEELIAQVPIEPRDHSRLLVLNRKNGELTHCRFYNLPEFLKPGDTLVFNDTKVMPARLIGIKADTGGKVEVFLLHRHSDTDWEALVKPGRRLRPGAKVVFSPELSCEILATTDFGGRIVRFRFEGIFEEILDRLGETPLPPYIRQRLADKDRYQTVYAREQGSAAAPTAGLHFTKELMEKLRHQGVNLAFITLHVGLGTFRPVSVSNIEEHKMHREFYAVSADTAAVINATKERGNRVIAVGTTAVRTLETIASNGRVKAASGWTDIFIYPGFKFQIIDGLVTNFHLPQSTLLMLVSAFATWELIMRAYHEAIRQKYRFFSFGDAMLII